MNILEIEDVIKGLPDQALMQEAQAPSGQMPQFLVVSEIQRRADMRKRFQNQQQEMPQGTIAQQIVQGGIASMGNQQPIQPMPQQGMPPQGMPPMPPQGMPPAMQQQPPMSPPMSPPMMGQPPMQPQGMAAGGVVRMQAGLQTPYTGGTENYRNLIDQALMAGATSSDIQALIGSNPEAQAVYNSMRGPDPQTASILYGEEFDGRKAVVGGSPGYTPYYLRDSDEDRRKAFLENIEYNQRQREIISGSNPETDYIPAYLSNFVSMPDTQGATSDSIRSQNKRQQDKLDQIRNQTDGESIFDLERFSRMMEMNSPNYSLFASGLGFNSQENLSNRNENVPAQQARSPSIGSSVLTDKLAETLTKEKTPLGQQNIINSPFQGTGLTEYGQNLFSHGLQEGQTVEEIVRNIYNYRPSTKATARRGLRRDPDQPSTEEYIKSVYGDDFSTPGLYSGAFRGPGAESLYMEEVMGRIGGSVPVTESPIPSSLTTSPTGLPPYKKLDTSSYDPITGDFLTPYLNKSVAGVESLPQATQEDVARVDPAKIDQAAVDAGLAATTPEEKAAADMTKKSSDPDYMTKKSSDPDYEALRSVLDGFKPVDYSAFKPDYLNLITEQERRAQKIRDDASKDASAQALIQLGAGLAAGDISKGLSAAGQSVADIKRQARAEARDEEGFARQLRLAQDEAGMQLGVKGAEAERELAKFKATYGVDLVELEQTLILARERIDSEEATEAGRALRGRLEALNNLIKNLVSDPFAGDMEQNKAAIAQAVAEMKSLLGITGEKQDKSSGTDVVEAAKAILGTR